MNVESSLLKCESALDKLANFLERHRAIFDVCMVDFVTKNISDIFWLFEHFLGLPRCPKGSLGVP